MKPRVFTAENLTNEDVFALRARLVRLTLECGDIDSAIDGWLRLGDKASRDRLIGYLNEGWGQP